jgi:hypothetical protein
MHDRVRYHYKLRQLHAEKEKTRSNNAKMWREAEKGKKPRSDLQGRDARLIDDDISQLSSDYYEREAQRLLLQVPEFSERSDKWEKLAFTERWRLTRSTMLELRSAIRTERRERSEHARLWLAGITGVIGALIGLLAIILGRR